MNVLLLGSGGREHALALALSRSPALGTLVIAPGNPGMADLGLVASVPLADHDALLALATDHQVDLVVIGPEVPLVDGFSDRARAAGFQVFGPTRAAAQLEGSKSYTKDFCRAHDIPTAAYEVFREAEPAKAYARRRPLPLVVKADGLAAGKGVIIAETLAAAEAAIDDIFGGRFGDAGASVVIEEFLEGEELSFFALCDGRRAVAFGSAQDHKRVGDGDTGPNTGGMGAVSPAPLMTTALEVDIMARIIEPTVEGMAARGVPFQGVLFAGLMVGSDGPKLIEYNVRFGDPEAEVLLLRLDKDLLPLLAGCAAGDLRTERVTLGPRRAVGVVMAATGYPDAPVVGSRIAGLERAGDLADVTVFQAGTRMTADGLVAAGGRVLVVAATGGTAADAQARAYDAVDRIDWPGGFCRRDIGWRAVAREQAVQQAASNDSGPEDDHADERRLLPRI